jgi:hypothetical protein
MTYIRLCALQNIIRSYRQAGLLAVQKLRELSINIGTDDKTRQRDMMVKCAMTSMNSKLVRFLTPHHPKHVRRLRGHKTANCATVCLTSERRSAAGQR